MRHLALFAVLLLVGCPDNPSLYPPADVGEDAGTDMAEPKPDLSEVETGPPDGPVTAEQYEQALHRTLCDVVYNCLDRAVELVPLSMANYGRWDSEEACVLSPIFKDFIEIQHLERAIARGTVQYDAETMGECLREFRTEACNGVPIDEASLCAGIFAQGTEGDDCEFNYECQGDEAVCAGGIECVQGGDCTKCGICTADPVLVCGTSRCEFDEYCDVTECVARAAEGEPCMRAEGCVDDLRCLVLPDESDGTCILPNSKAEGEDCATSDHCQGELVCADDVCAPVAFQAAGENCEPPTKPCDVGHYCDGCLFGGTNCLIGGTCQPLEPLNGACGHPIECQGGFTCEENLCVPDPPKGLLALCRNSRECDEGQCHTIDGVCVETTRACE